MLIRSACLFLSSAAVLAAATPSVPTLMYSTYLREGFTPSAIATDLAGNIYVAGNAIIYPASSQTTVLVLKLDPQGGSYLYTRYVGGSVNESASAIAVDSAGNVYVAGVTNSPDFPVTTPGNFGTAPTANTERSFVFELDPQGRMVFSDLLGGSVNSYPQAVAVNALGQIVVSGTSVDAGFPSTPGVYSVSDTSFSPYLLELSPGGSKLMFSATGIGGSAIAFDTSGNIYVAGTTGSLTYPTTPGAYQPSFPVFQTCIAPCHGFFQGYNQYVTKLDPSGSRLIFSTAVSGTGNTANQGLAVDSAGNVYLTGLAGADYPYTVTAPSIPLAPALATLTTPALPFLTKLDPAGQKLLYSVPVGGAGVQVDANGIAYVGGVLGPRAGYDVAASLPALASLPAACLASVAIGGHSGYVSQVDAAGNVLASQFLGGSTLNISGVTLAGANLWIAGATGFADFAYTPNTLSSLNPQPVAKPGAYLGAVSFAQTEPAPGTAQIGCVVDAGDLQPTGPIAPYQLLTIFGTGLGPAQAQSASNDTTTTLGGVSVSFGAASAPLLYVSSNQINLAVPAVSPGTGSAMQVSVNGVTSPLLQFPIASANPRLFVVPGSYQTNFQQFEAVALNADGSVNSPANPAATGSVISVFVNGLSASQGFLVQPPMLYAGGGWTVMNSSQSTPFVLQVQLRIPSSSANFACQLANTNACAASFKVYDLSSYLAISSAGGGTGLSFAGIVYVTP